MTSTTQKIGFIGVGMMGYPMASRLHQARYTLMLLDAVPATVKRFIDAHPGAIATSSAEELAAADVVITMLPNSDIVDATVLGATNQRGLVDILQDGATVIDMSSSQPMRSKSLANALRERGLHFLDAPVSGGVKRAVDGSLAIMVGGEQTQFDAQAALFKEMGKVVTHVGPAGAGHAVKALNNYVSAAGLVAAAEALLVAQKFGLDPAIVTDVFNNSTGKNNSTENKAKQFMLSGAFNSGFSLQLMAKDLGIAMNLGESVGRSMPLGRETLRLWSDAAVKLDMTADHTEMYRYLQQIEN
ncbi:MAG: NAD(P)-dependent oxidoreductase [Betaproteobacteria bacterium]